MKWSPNKSSAHVTPYIVIIVDYIYPGEKPDNS